MSISYKSETCAAVKAALDASFRAGHWEQVFVSTQTPSFAHWMGTRSHLKRDFTCNLVKISGASSYNCCYKDYGIYLNLMNRQNYFLVFGARTGLTLVSMKSKHYSQEGRGYQQIRDC